MSDVTMQDRVLSVTAGAVWTRDGKPAYSVPGERDHAAVA